MRVHHALEVVTTSKGIHRAVGDLVPKYVGLFED